MAKASSLASMRGFSVAAMLSLVFLYAPIVILIVFSFNKSNLITVWEGFTFDWYPIALENDDLKRAAINSLIIAFCAMIVSTALAIPAALATHKKVPPYPGRAFVYGLIALPLLIPEIVMAIGTLLFFSFIGLQSGIVNVMLAHIVFCIPFAYFPIRARLETIDPRLWEAGADLYAGSFQVFRYITLPLLKPGLLSGAMLAFITSLDDFIITQMVSPPGATTLPVYIYGMIRRGITPEINAVSSILLIVSLVFVSLSYALSRRDR